MSSRGPWRTSRRGADTAIIGAESGLANTLCVRWEGGIGGPGVATRWTVKLNPGFRRAHQAPDPAPSVYGVSRVSETIEYLHSLLREVENLEDAAAVHQRLDDLEFLYDAVDPPLQELVEQVIERLNERLKVLT